MITITEPGLTGSATIHARLSPSDSKRLTTCTAALAFQEANAHRVRKDEGSRYADEGTEMHEWSAKVMLKHCTIEDVPELGMLGNDLRPHVKAYVDHCMSTLPAGAVLQSIELCDDMADIGADAPAHMYTVEESIPNFYQPDQSGTADFVGVISENGVVKRMIGRDLKGGAGVLVKSFESSQLAIYNFSAIQKLSRHYTFEPDTLIDLHVFQPRHREGSEQTPWVLTLADFTTFCHEIEYKMIQVRTGADRVREKIGSPGRDVSPEEILEAAPGLRFHPEEGDGGSCRWCRCKAWCGKRLAALTEDMGLPALPAVDLLACMPDLDKESKKLPVEERIATTFAEMNEFFIDNGTVVPDSYLVTLYRRAKGIKKFLEDVEEYLSGRVTDGEEIEGVKLVEGTFGDRRWANEEAADTFLAGQKISADDRYTRKVVSPTVAEKLLKEKLKTVKRTATRFNELITRSSPKRVLALADDKRPAVSSSIAAMPDIGDADDEVGFE